MPSGQQIIAACLLVWLVLAEGGCQAAQTLGCRCDCHMECSAGLHNFATILPQHTLAAQLDCVPGRDKMWLSG